MLASENGALPGGKVGGIGDVIRDLPVALAECGWSVIVLTPSYGAFSTLPEAKSLAQTEVAFAGQTQTVELFEIELKSSGVRHFVVEHPQFSPHGRGQVYCDDGSHAPFATDATKFAFFSASAAAVIKARHVNPDVVHLHDWHAALFLALRAFDPSFARLRDIRTVFTIHNLALQGIRPLSGHESALASWFPGLNYHHDRIVDPRYHDCVNPVALAIRLADAVNTVSPTYATEILQPNNPLHGFHGGEGLEADLQQADREGRLSGILNGCDYAGPRTKKASWKALREAFKGALEHWIGRTIHVRSSHFTAFNKVKTRLARKPKMLAVSIGRITHQKVGLFLQPTSHGPSALEAILDGLAPGELFVMLGSGDNELCRALTQISQRRGNFLFLDGYINQLPDLLYATGDLFLMPSSFEPCGISQMFAMRAGQPCVVHGVGGLTDTVDHGRTGFIFSGDTPAEQADALVETVRKALELRSEDESAWKAVCNAARAERFSWQAAAKQYELKLYAEQES